MVRWLGWLFFNKNSNVFDSLFTELKNKSEILGAIISICTINVLSAPSDRSTDMYIRLRWPFFGLSNKLSSSNRLNVDHRGFKISNVAHLIEEIDDPWSISSLIRSNTSVCTVRFSSCFVYKTILIITFDKQVKSMPFPVGAFFIQLRLKSLFSLAGIELIRNSETLFWCFWNVGNFFVTVSISVTRDERGCFISISPFAARRNNCVINIVAGGAKRRRRQSDRVVGRRIFEFSRRETAK